VGTVGKRSVEPLFLKAAVFERSLIDPAFEVGEVVVGPVVEDHRAAGDEAAGAFAAERRLRRRRVSRIWLGGREGSGHRHRKCDGDDPVGEEE